MKLRKTIHDNVIYLNISLTHDEVCDAWDKKENILVLESVNFNNYAHDIMGFDHLILRNTTYHTSSIFTVSRYDKTYDDEFLGKWYVSAHKNVKLLIIFNH